MSDRSGIGADPVHRAAQALALRVPLVHVGLGAGDAGIALAIELALRIVQDLKLGVVALHLTGKPRFELAGVEASDGGGATRACTQAFPVGWGRVAQGRESPEAGYDNTSDRNHRLNGF